MLLMNVMNGNFVIKVIVKDTQQDSGPKSKGLDLDGCYRCEYRRQEHKITSGARICETEQRGVKSGAVRLRESLNSTVSVGFLHLSTRVEIELGSLEQALSYQRRRTALKDVVCW
jgi:hypothetical protein